jgi:hypothetical protein
MWCCFFFELSAEQRLAVRLRSWRTFVAVR